MIWATQVDNPEVCWENVAKVAASFYSKTGSRDYLGRFTDRNSAFEVVHHLALAGDYRELYDLRTLVYEEAYPAARTLYSQRQYDEALHLFLRLAETRPHDPAVWAYIGRCHGRRGQWNDCDNAFEHALEVATAMKQPTSWIHRDWGHIRARFGFYDEAIPHLRQAQLTGGSQDPGAVSCEAYLYWKTGDIPKAGNLFEGVLRDHPKHTYSLTTYASLLDEQGNTDYADELRARLAVIRDEMTEPEAFDFEPEAYADD